MRMLNFRGAKGLYKAGGRVHWTRRFFPGESVLKVWCWSYLRAYSSTAASQVVVYIYHRQLHASFDHRARGGNPGGWIEFDLNKPLQLF